MADFAFGDQIPEYFQGLLDQDHAFFPCMVVPWFAEEVGLPIGPVQLIDINVIRA